jgi:hypothetical protein
MLLMTSLGENILEAYGLCGNFLTADRLRNMKMFGAENQQGSFFNNSGIGALLLLVTELLLLVTFTSWDFSWAGKT